MKKDRQDSFSHVTVLPRTPRALPSHPWSHLWQIGFILVTVTSWIQDAATSPGIVSTPSSPCGKQEKNACRFLPLNCPFPFPWTEAFIIHAHPRALTGEGE